MSAAGDPADDPTDALIDVDDLRARLDGRELPGAELAIEPYESALADHALLAPPEPGSGHAHPSWFVVLALRGMGVTVDELCDLAGKRTQDTLLYANCALEQDRPLVAGRRFRTTAVVGPVTRKSSRSGGVLDFVDVVVEVRDRDGEHDGALGRVTHGFVLRRAA